MLLSMLTDGMKTLCSFYAHRWDENIILLLMLTLSDGNREEHNVFIPSVSIGRSIMFSSHLSIGRSIIFSSHL
jgi:hypothetical protein